MTEGIGPLDLGEHVKHNFLYSACEPSKKGERLCTMEVEVEDGIWCRVDATDIKML